MILKRFWIKRPRMMDGRNHFCVPQEAVIRAWKHFLSLQFLFFCCRFWRWAAAQRESIQSISTLVTLSESEFKRNVGAQPPRINIANLQRSRRIQAQYLLHHLLAQYGKRAVLEVRRLLNHISASSSRPSGSDGRPRHSAGPWAAARRAHIIADIAVDRERNTEWRWEEGDDPRNRRCLCLWNTKNQVNDKSCAR